MEKVARAWRARRTFTNNQGAFKLSKPRILSTIVHVKASVDIDAILESKPKGFTNVAGYRGTGRKPVKRFVGSNWISAENNSGVSQVVAKKGTQTVVLKRDSIEVLGTGNYEAAFLAIVKNGWSSKDLLSKKPDYKKIDCAFNVNRRFFLHDLASQLRTKLPMKKQVRYESEIFPAVILKLEKPAWTYQFFANGTVLYTGIKDPADVDAPRELFKEFFTKYDVYPYSAMNTIAPAFIKVPVVNAENKKKKLAERYPLAGTWNALKPAPIGFYIRPGTNGKPRFYKYRNMQYEPQTGEWLNRGPINLKGVGPKVIKAFQKVGQPIPENTRLALGLKNTSVPVAPAAEGRRAPNWNATKPGFYVRPGPGQQPYWFKIPKGLDSGRKTVISTYTKAGRNIPKAVRDIFKIGENVKTETLPNHAVTMGLNGILRINGRQATRLTKKQLITIARNLQIPQVNESMNPDRIMAYIREKAGVSKANRGFNVTFNGVQYVFLPFGRVQRTVGKKRTERNWVTLPNKNSIAKAYLPEALHANWNKTKNYQMIINYKNRPRTPARTPSKTPSNNNNNVNLGNFAANLEKELLTEGHRNAYRNLVGNYYRNENFNRLLTRLNKLPEKAKKANVNRAIKTFAKEAIVRARHANYRTKITVPNWIPANKQNAYRNAMLNVATHVNNKGKYPTQKTVREAMRAWINAQIPKVPRAAYNKENVLTGVVTRIPSWNPPAKFNFNVPKRLSPPRLATKPKPAAKPKVPKVNTKKKRRIGNNENNLGSNMIRLGINTNGAYSWNNLVRLGVNKKYKTVWARQPSVPGET